MHDCVRVNIMGLEIIVRDIFLLKCLFVIILFITLIMGLIRFMYLSCLVFGFFITIALNLGREITASIDSSFFSDESLFNRCKNK